MAKVYRRKIERGKVYRRKIGSQKRGKVYRRKIEEKKPKYIKKIENHYGPGKHRYIYKYVSTRIRSLFKKRRKKQARLIAARSGVSGVRA